MVNTASATAKFGVLDRGLHAGLAALPPQAIALLRPHLKMVTAASGTALWEPGTPARQTWFPESAIVSVAMPMPDGGAVEVAMIGNEGAAGGLHDTDAPVTRGVVLIGGSMVQIETEKLIALAKENREIDDLVRFCRDWLMTQARQLAACNATHSADKRLCRWLVCCQERMKTGHIDATQELIGTLLGIRRTTVTLTAQLLHEQGLIDYARGKILVRDSARLKAAACTCHDPLGPQNYPSTRLAAVRRAGI
jgi:Crp-like helix-turn-helix protein